MGTLDFDRELLTWCDVWSAMQATVLPYAEAISEQTDFSTTPSTEFGFQISDIGPLCALCNRIITSEPAFK